MQVKQSFTASGMYSSSGPFTSLLPIEVAAPGLSSRVALLEQTEMPHDSSARSELRPPWPTQASVHGEGLLHDARNLMGTLGLYCDLLSMPDVLKPEHRQYADELRLVGTRSGALIEHLIQDLTQSRAHTRVDEPGFNAPLAASEAVCSTSAKQPVHEAWPVQNTLPPVKTVSLRTIVQRCSGLLGRVACGRTIEVSYGEAAAVPLRVAEEAVERILVNLVRNSAAALGEIAPKDHRLGEASHNPVRATPADTVPGRNSGAIRIGVGLLGNRVGTPKPWPFRWVRLTVEDSGGGMNPEQIERLLCGCMVPSRSGHGIGFRVVQDLVGASNGDLRVTSAPGIGTRVQIEWPVAAAPSAARSTGSLVSVAGRWVSC